VRRAAVVVAAIAGFGLLAVAYRHHPLAGWDADVATWVAEHLPTWAEWLARPFSWLGGWIGVTALTALASVVLLRRREWLDLGFLLVAVLGSQLVVALLKLWFDRPRPDVDPAVPLPSSASFPSGHAAGGIACVGAVAVLAAERLPSRRARTGLWVATVTLGVAVGLSRIALGVHYVSDVLAGWCLGLAWLAACLLARDAIRRRA
jgi:undecaprenyl-diphosphatase